MPGSTISIEMVIFYTLLFFSTVSVMIILWLFRSNREQLLLRCLCMMLLLMQTTIILWPVYHWGQIDKELMNSSLCKIQAVFLNYCYVFIHAATSLIMFHNCCVGLMWRLSLFGHEINLPLTLTVLSFVIPLLFQIELFIKLSSGNYSWVVSPGPFYCSIQSNSPWSKLVILLLFAIPGCFFAVYLLYKTIRNRQRTMNAFGNATQFPLSYVVRIFISTFFYHVLALGSCIPLILIGFFPNLHYDIVELTERISKLNSNLIKSPFLVSYDMCSNRFNHDSENYTPETGDCALWLCPNALTYAPVLVGVFLFILYGLSVHAQSIYRAIFRRFFTCTKRRNSQLPLMVAVSPVNSPSFSSSRLPKKSQFSSELTSDDHAIMTASKHTKTDQRHFSIELGIFAFDSMLNDEEGIEGDDEGIIRINSSYDDADIEDSIKTTEKYSRNSHRLSAPKSPFKLSKSRSDEELRPRNSPIHQFDTNPLGRRSSLSDIT